jgi:hypothetical protein
MIMNQLINALIKRGLLVSLNRPGFPGDSVT